MLKDIARFFVGMLIPVIMIVLGGLLVSLALSSNSSTLLIIGFCVLGAGILWGAYLLYY